MISTNYNPSVLTTQRNLNLASFNLNTALERMSTGYKVNCAADDAAGMFVASNLNANIRGLKQAQKNAQDGISLLNTAEGSLSNMTNILNRLRDLAVQGANGVYDENSLDAMQNEADSLVAQLKQIQQGTLFNGKSIFNTNATWSLTTQNAGTATISTLSGGGVSAKTPDTNSLAGINTLNSTPDAKSSSGFIQQINRLSEQEAIAQGYTVIKTAQDLDNIRNDLDGKYILMNDIDLSSYSNWDPIGEVDSNGIKQGFTGVLDGNGYTISNLNNMLFYAIGFLDVNSASIISTGEVKNLGIENVSIVNAQNGSSGIAAVLSGSVSNCYVTGNISGDGNLSAIAGVFAGTIENTYAEISISGSSAIGALAGMGVQGVIKNSYAIGDITGTENAIGGLVGNNYLVAIENCWSGVNVSGEFGVGGIVGQNLSGDINKCYSIGELTAISGAIVVQLLVELLPNLLFKTQTGIQKLQGKVRLWVAVQEQRATTRG